MALEMELDAMPREVPHAVFRRFARTRDDRFFAVAEVSVDRNCALTFAADVKIEATSGSRTTATTGRFIRDANRFGLARE
jgi:hypothetical protein